MRNQLAAYMNRGGYSVLSTNLNEFVVLIKREFSFVDVIMVMEIPSESNFDSTAYTKLRDSAEKLLSDKGITDMHTMTLLLSDNARVVAEACSDDKFSWIVDTSQKVIVVAEDKVQDYYGLREKLREFLITPNAFGTVEIDNEGNVTIVEDEDELQSESKKTSSDNTSDVEVGKTNNYKVPWMVTIVVILNTLVFFVSTLMGESIYALGALSVDGVIRAGEWYRVLTSMFLHVDISHIFSNMLMLYLLGELLEKQVGKWGFLLAYTVAGIGGNICSLAFSSYFMDDTLSVGASGAIYGIVGALLWLTILNKGRLAYLTTSKTILLIVFILYTGFINKGVNNVAHIGGLLFGFICAIPLSYLLKLKEKTHVNQEEEQHED